MVKRCSTYIDAAQYLAEQLRTREVSLDTNHIIIVPDKFTLACERYFMDALGEGGSFDVSVLTLARLMNKIAPKSGGYISPQGAAMAIKLIAAQNEQNLLCFSRACASPNFAAEMFKTISQLKSCKISPAQISGRNIIIEKGSLLYRKLCDISLIYTEYNKFLNENDLKDASDRMEVLINSIPTSGYIKSSYFYILGFDSVTPQMKEVFNLLEKYSKGVIHTEVSLDGEQNGPPAYSALKDSFHIHLRDNLLKFPFDSYDQPAPIYIYTAVDRASMTEAAARIIRQYVKSGYKYNEIAIIGNLTQNDLTALDEAKIPYNFDHKEPLSAHPLSRFILCALDAVSTGYFKGFTEIAKNAFSGVEFEDAEALQNYCLKYNIAGRVREPFKFDDPWLNSAEKARKIIYKYLEPFERDCQVASTVGDHINAVKKLLERIDADKKCQKYLEICPQDYRPFAEQAYQKLESVLSAAAILSGHSIKTVEFMEILSSGIASVEISAIPPMADAVDIGAPGAFRFWQYKVLIYTDTVEGSFPALSRDDGMLTDAELERMGKTGQAIVPKIKEVNKLAKSELVMSMFLGSRLVFLYPQTVCGIKLKKAFLLAQIEKIFPNRSEAFQEQEESILRSEAALWKEAPPPLPSSEAAAARLFYKEYNLARASLQKTLSQPLSALYHAFNIPLPGYQSSPDSVEDAGSLFFYNDRAAVTNFETYFTCPYKHFAAHGLRLKERKIGGEGDPALFGVILHAFAQRFINNIYNIESENDVPAASDKIMEELKDNDFIHESYWGLIDALKPEARALGAELYRQAELSDFKTIATEAEINENSKYKPLVIKTPKGELKICGKIDRIDAFEDYVRIIDYKTGKIKEGWLNVYYGLNIQLLAYLAALVESGFKPAGALYFPINYDYLKNSTDRFKAAGFLSDNLRVLYAMDKNLLTLNKSDIIPLRLKKEGIPYENDQNYLLSGYEFSSALNYCKNLVTKAAEEILEGYIDSAPVSDACSYCDFSGVCATRQKNERKLPSSAKKESVTLGISPDLTWDDIDGEGYDE